MKSSVCYMQWVSDNSDAVESCMALSDSVCSAPGPPAPCVLHSVVPRASVRAGQSLRLCSYSFLAPHQSGGLNACPLATSVTSSMVLKRVRKLV